MEINAEIDGNFERTLIAVSSVDGETPVRVWADPTTHRLLVDGLASGGGSTVGVEIPIGTVNGVNTVFTVSNTPIFIDTSGQVNVSMATDPTNYGYTFSSGTITFVNAPTQTPHSFYNSAAGSSVLASFFETDSFTSTSSQTVFTTTLVPTFVLSFIVNDQPQTLTVDYTQSGAVFTLLNGIPAGLPVTITYIHS